jgi:hypothetical protein
MNCIEWIYSLFSWLPSINKKVPLLIYLLFFFFFFFLLIVLSDETLCMLVYFLFSSLSLLTKKGNFLDFWFTFMLVVKQEKQKPILFS